MRDIEMTPETPDGQTLRVAQDAEERVYHAYEAARRLRTKHIIDHADFDVVLAGLHAARRFIFNSYTLPAQNEQNWAAANTPTLQPRAEDADTRRFPIQSTPREVSPCRSVPWVMAEKAWGTYRARYGEGQTLERMAERGGFGWREFAYLYAGLDDYTATDAQRQAALDAVDPIRRQLEDSDTLRQHHQSAKEEYADMKAELTEQIQTLTREIPCPDCTGKSAGSYVDCGTCLGREVVTPFKAAEYRAQQFKAERDTLRQQLAEALRQEGHYHHLYELRLRDFVEAQAQLATTVQERNELERRLGDLLSTLGICYGQDERAAVLALIGAVVDAGGHPTAIARAAAQQAPKWRLSEAEQLAALQGVADPGRPPSD